jgi:ribonuclease-3
MPNTKNHTQFSDMLGYSFKQEHLLEVALRHASCVNESGDPGLEDNERLEFLGDAVLDLAISHLLMDRFKDAKEGELSKYRAKIVNERGLSKIARNLGLGDYLAIGKGEELTGGREKPSILADTLEAILGALYLDAGFLKTMEIIEKLFLPSLMGIEPGRNVTDYKSLLQEYTQEYYQTRPEYIVVGESGPPHDKTFRVAIRLQGDALAEGEGKSKKAAEQKAAKEALYCLKEDPREP